MLHNFAFFNSNVEEAEFEKHQFSFRESTIWNSNESKKNRQFKNGFKMVFNKCNLDQNINSSMEGKCINPNKNLGSSVYSR